jgi:hypothetical protein
MGVEEMAMLSALQRENGTCFGLPTLRRDGSIRYLGATYEGAERFRPWGDCVRVRISACFPDANMLS